MIVGYKYKLYTTMLQASSRILLCYFYIVFIDVMASAQAKHLSSPAYCFDRNLDHCKTEAHLGDYWHGQCYDPKTQICCGLKVHHVPKELSNSLECCEGSIEGALINKATQKCTPKGPVPKHFIQCGAEWYDKKEKICCRGSLHAVGLKCCGVNAYDFDWDLCCDFTVHHGKKHSHKCDGKGIKPRCPKCLTNTAVTHTNNATNASVDKLAISYGIVLHAKVSKSTQRENIAEYQLTKIRDSRGQTKMNRHYKPVPPRLGDNRFTATILMNSDCPCESIKPKSKIFVMTNKSSILTGKETLLADDDILMEFDRGLRKRIRRLKSKMF